MSNAGTLDPLERTLFLPLWGRWSFARQCGAELHPADVGLADRFGLASQEFERSIGNYGALAFGLRAQWFDRRVRLFLERFPDGQVVNLGAGLDTTFERVDNQRCVGISVDSPAVADLRRASLPVNARHAQVGASLLSEDWLQHVEERAPTVFLLSGVSMYLGAPDVHALFSRLRRFPEAEVLFDAYSPAGMRLTNAMIRWTGLTEVPVQWALHDTERFAAEAGGWRVQEEVVQFSEALPWREDGLWCRFQIALARWVKFTRFLRFSAMQVGVPHAAC
jgi:O-methyltransferase involved in polyketide biosynthesis